MPASTSKAIIDNTNDTSEKSVDKDITQEYEVLNKKCDTVITKIKKRKEKQTKKIH